MPGMSLRVVLVAVALLCCGAMLWIVGYLALGGTAPAHFVLVVLALSAVATLAALPLLFMRDSRGSFLATSAQRTGAPADTYADPGELDPATGVLANEAFMRPVGAALRQGGGALLLIDATQFSVRRPHQRLSSRDEAMRLIAQPTRASVRGNDLVGRTGTAQFGVYLKGATDAVSAQVARRICESVENTIYLNEERTIGALSVNIGGAMTRPGLLEPYLKTARRMLDKAKRSGRGRFMVANLA